MLALGCVGFFLIYRPITFYNGGTMRQTELMAGPKTVTAFSLPTGMVAALRQRAKQEDRPYSWVVRRALIRYLGETEKPNRRKDGD
jgi:hypothetical protein